MQNRIKHLRERRGLTLLALAEKITPRTTRQQILRLQEKDPKALTAGWLTRLAKALEVTPEEITGWSDLHGNPRDEIAILSEADMSDQQLRLVHILAGDAPTLVAEVVSNSLLLAGIAPGSIAVFHRTRRPIIGARVLVQIDKGDGSHYALRMFREPHLVPASTEQFFEVFNLDARHVRIVGVMIASYLPCEPRPAKTRQAGQSDQPKPRGVAGPELVSTSKTERRAR